MDLCEHAFYKPEEKYTPSLYCKIDDKRCIYSKRCLKVDRFIPLEGEKWRECYKYIMEKRGIFKNHITRNKKDALTPSAIKEFDAVWENVKKLL